MHDAGPLSPILEWVNPRFGPISKFRGSRLNYPEPPWWLYQSDLVRNIGKYYAAENAAALGCSLDGDEAIRRSLGESVERYTGYNSLKAAELMQIAAGESELLPLFPYCLLDEECSVNFKGATVAYNRSTMLTHTPARRLKDGNHVWIPAGEMHLAFWPKAPEPIITLPISAGLSFHSGPVKAIWSGICELAERDQMMIFWWNKISIPKITIDKNTAGRNLSQRIFQIEKAGIKIHLLSMNINFPIPAIFCVLESDRFPFYVAGASAHEDAEIACCGAIDEAMSIRFSQVKYARDSVVESFEEFNWVKAFIDHATLYANWPNSPALDFLLKNNPNKLSLDDYKAQHWLQAPGSMDDLSKIATQLEALGLTVLWSDLTSTEAAELGTCVKVTIPEMVPLNVAHKVRWLACPRLNINKKESIRASDFNPYPHPFP